MEHASVLYSFGTRMEKSYFAWNIANFLKIKESDEQINAQETLFQIGSSIGLPLKFKCYLRLKKEEGVRYCAGIFVRLIHSEKDEHISSVLLQVTVDTPFQVVNLYCESAKSYTDQRLGCWGLPLDLINRMYSSKLTQDGAMPIRFVIKMYNLKVEPISFSVLTTILARYQTKFCGNFAKDLKQLLGKDSKYVMSLATLVSKDGVKFHVDKSLLAVRCPELCKLVDQGPLHIDSETLGIVLHFLNTGNLSANWRKEDVLPEFTLAVCLYKLKDFKGFLNQALGQVCTKKNAAKLLILAKKLGMKRARKELVDFIRNNFFMDKEKLETGGRSGGGGKHQRKKNGLWDKIKRFADIPETTDSD